jgi:outer membrane protein assembly factor BamA
LAFIAALCLTGAPTDEAIFPVRVDSIIISGLQWTNHAVVDTEIGYGPGDVIDRERFELGIARLWNTGIFSQVDAFIETNEGSTTVHYEIRERFFLAPVINFTIISSGAYWFRAGLKDINTFGRFIDVEAAYERYNTTNGGYVALREPRLFRTRMDLQARFERVSRPRPGFTTLQTHGVLALGTLALQDRFWIQGSVDVGFYDFLPPIAGETSLPEKTWTAAATLSLRAGRVDTVRLRQKHFSVELKPTLGLIFAQRQPLYAQAILEALAFFTLGTRWNFAFRLNMGISSIVPTELRLYVGGLDLIRGFPDNHLRTDFYAVCNAEVRFIAFDGLWDWLALMPVLFSDAVVARGERGGVKLAGSVGIGVRILVPKFPKTGLRIDVAQPFEARLPQLSVGAFQFF